MIKNQLSRFNKAKFLTEKVGIRVLRYVGDSGGGRVAVSSQIRDLVSNVGPEVLSVCRMAY
jgi:hypothetical protein